MGAEVSARGNRQRGIWTGALMMTTALTAVCVAETSWAQGGVPPVQQAQLAQAQQNFDIASQPLVDALVLFGRQSGVQVSVDAAVIRDIASPGVRGAMTAEQALGRLLAGTGITYRLTGANTAMLQRAQAGGDGTIELAPVRIEGVARNAGQTEGTGSYTTNAVTIGKTPTSLRETPQSMSVVTRQRLDDQNISELGSALKSVTGLTVRRNDGTGLFNFYDARGYTSDVIMRDGMSMQGDVGNQVTLDLAIYDRVEVQRGAAGLFKGAGDPGVTINLARKRALVPLQFSGQLGYGSWDTYRGEADVTGALTDSGHVRGRLVAVGDDRESYLKGVESNKKLLYGTLEFDLTENTTLSVGGAYQDSHSIFSRGLPAYADGRLLDVSRSTDLVASWTPFDGTTIEGFAELEHRLDTGGSFKFAARHDKTKSTSTSLQAASAVPASGMVPFIARDNRRDPTDTSLDAFFDTPFEFGGQKHNFLIGADYRIRTLEAFERRSGLIGTFNVLSFDPNSVPEPTAYPTINTNQRNETESYGLYNQIRIKPIDALTLIGGARLSWYESETLNRLTNNVSKSEASAEFTPYGGIVVDLNSSLSLYGSYAQIFQPQTQTTVTGDVLPPRIGSQIETGIKGEFFDKRLNAHAAVFRIQDENRALADPANPGFSTAAGEVRSQGFEAEINGQLAERWNITAGYAYTTTEFITGTATQTGQSFSTSTPKHTFNLWTQYKFPENFLPGLELGGGFRAVSDFHTQVGNARFQGDAYTVASLAVGYKINEHFHAALNVENLFDATYYERVLSSTGGSYYGAPRSFMLTLRGTW